MKPKSILTLSAIFLGLLSSCGTSSTANNISSKSEENYLFSKDGISLLSQDLTYNEFTGYALHVLARNETDRNIIIHSTSCTYNSYMFPAILYAEVNASSSLEEDIFFLDQTTTSFGIDKPEEFILSFTVLDADTYETLFLIDDISYKTKDIYTAFLISLYHLITYDSIFIRKCKNCSNYFITFKNNVVYCDRLYTSNETCKDIGYKISQKRKEEKEYTYGKYRRIYAKKAMLVKRNPDIEKYRKDYEIWKKEAKKFMKDINNGVVTYNEFDKWLEDHT